MLGQQRDEGVEFRCRQLGHWCLLLFPLPAKPIMAKTRAGRNQPRACTRRQVGLREDKPDLWRRCCMTWVKTFAENEATGQLAEVYGEILKHPLSIGGVPNIMKSMGLRPEALEFLQQRGFSEAQVVDIVLITCLFNFMDRLADGLGVELDPRMQKLVAMNADKG